MGNSRLMRSLLGGDELYLRISDLQPTYITGYDDDPDDPWGWVYYLPKGILPFSFIDDDFTIHECVGKVALN